MKNMIGILVCLPMLCMAQTNLVLNGDFESHATLQANDCTIEDASPWFDTGFSVDYFNSNRPPLVFTPDTIPHCGVPENNRGYQYARSGIGYGGFHAFSKNEPNGREFIQIELSQPLSKTVRYEVSFHVSLADDFKYAIKTIGAYFSQNPISRIQYEIDDLNIAPQITNNSMLLDDKENWQEVRDTLVGRTGIEGGERYLVIGNFNLDETSDTVMLETGLYDHSYYYIDDVSVVALDSVPSGIADAEALGFELWPNPAKEFVQFRISDSSASRKNGTGSSSVGMTVQVLDALGRSVAAFPLQKGVSAGRGISGELDVSTLPIGIYFLELTDQEGNHAVRKFVKE